VPSPQQPLRIVTTVVGTTFRVARTVAELGVKATGAVAVAAARRVTASGHDDGATGAASTPVDAPEPVNVVEELDLDPAPVDPDAGEPEPSEEAVTSIDAQADPDAVDVTPDDVAGQIGRGPGTD